MSTYFSHNLRQQLKDLILPSIVASLKLSFFVISAGILTFLTYTQVAKVLAPSTPVSIPINFIPEVLTESKMSFDRPLRQNHFLQGNFSLLSYKYLEELLYVGTE